MVGGEGKAEDGETGGMAKTERKGTSYIQEADTKKAGA
ncbi:hypothetical protein GFS31_13090 [Leptolyngbya sp. BL0902]|nr:hypothetical protein GFS31_13090 [Leptolyngbya sp. BL0902]